MPGAHSEPLTDPLPVRPLARPFDATVHVPGSKSITNRALPAAALAPGTSVLHGVGEGDDVEAMIECLRALGVTIDLDAERNATVAGTGGELPPGPTTIDVRQSGTTARFLSAILAFGAAEVRVEAHPQMQSRPMGPLVEVLRTLGARVSSDGDDGTLPYTISPIARSRVADVLIPGGTSSQFVSGLLLSTPLHRSDAITFEVERPLVSVPYIRMTAAVMAAFGVTVDLLDDDFYEIDGTQRYVATEYTIEPDASGATYFFAAAALAGGRVAVPGLGRTSLQGDVGFVDLLGRLGAHIEVGADATTVTGTGTLHGIDVDMADLSDAVPTLAAVAAFADSPTRITGVGFIRHKESDRIGNVVAELRRAGVHAAEEDDGLVIDPSKGSAHSAVVETYDDHRMAMAFALLGLRVDGVEIAGPGCVSKTYPGYWRDLEALRA
jgi:3-phosphoshikimate 1-carboxyvinyltransferase